MEHIKWRGLGREDFSISAFSMWIVCQIGAREHYAIARALQARGALAGLCTDFWVPPGDMIGMLPGARRLRDRFHPDLADAQVHAPNARMFAFELKQRLVGKRGWDAIIARNEWFQQWALQEMAKISDQGPSIPSLSAPMGTNGPARRSSPTVFSYSYAALEIFRYAKSRGWRTVLGQIDPGPEEERIVAAERGRYRHLASSWQAAPTTYWESWREELDLADRIIVNSEWSRQCLLKEKVPSQKIEIVPLVYRAETEDASPGNQQPSEVRRDASNIQNPTFKSQNPPSKRVLFLGQVNLRKGVGRLLDAMRMLKDEPIELTLAGPTEIDPAAWADLPNVRWVGPVARSEVGRVYQEADYFILPTLSDGYALTQLEALSHGLPVMASKHCGAAVSHGGNGWILDDLEPKTIATAIRHAIANPLDSTQIRPPDFSITDLAAALTR
jgi:glycosyltransferase involved in cell wall biosynthesis